MKKNEMRVIVRGVFSVLLVLVVLGTGRARGEEDWVEYTQGEVKWKYQLIEGGATCRIAVSDWRTLGERVAIPGEVVAGGQKIEVVEVAKEAFKFGIKVKEVTFPASIKVIGQDAFKNLSLQRVAIPAGVVEIGAGAFSGCISLTEFIVDAANPKYTGEGCVLYSRDKRELVCCAASAQGIFGIPDGVETILDWAFVGCRDLQTIEIPASVTRIGEGAFYLCVQLEGFKVAEDNASYSVSAPQQQE